MSRDNEIKKLMEAILQIDDQNQLAATNQFNYLAAMRGLVVMIEGFTGDPQCKDSQSIAAYCRSLHYLIDTSIADGLSMLACARGACIDNGVISLSDDDLLRAGDVTIH